MSAISRRFAFTVSVLTLLLVRPAVAQSVLYSTDFESPTFADGSKLIGQDGWVSRVGRNADAPLVTSAAAFTGSQGVEIRGADMTEPFGDPTQWDAICAARQFVNFDALAHGDPIITISADVFLDGPVTGTADTDPNFLAHLEAYSDTGVPYGAIGIWSDGFVHAIDGPGITRQSILGSVPIQLGTWHNLAMQLDIMRQQHAFFVDGVLMGVTSSAFQNGADVSDVLSRGTMTVYNGLFGADPTPYVARYDNFRIAAGAATAPEPGTLALALPVCLLSLQRITRRRKR